MYMPGWPTCEASSGMRRRLYNLESKLPEHSPPDWDTKLSCNHGHPDLATDTGQASLRRLHPPGLLVEKTFSLVITYCTA